MRPRPDPRLERYGWCCRHPRLWSRHRRNHHRVSRYIKHTKRKPIISVAVEAAASPVLTKQRAGQPLNPAGHRIQGIGGGFVPKVLDLSLVDQIEQVTNEEAFEYALRLTREEGILSGISCAPVCEPATSATRTDVSNGVPRFDREHSAFAAMITLTAHRSRWH